MNLRQPEDTARVRDNRTVRETGSLLWSGRQEETLRVLSETVGPPTSTVCVDRVPQGDLYLLKRFGVQSLVHRDTSTTLFWGDIVYLCLFALIISPVSLCPMGSVGTTD